MSIAQLSPTFFIALAAIVVACQIMHVICRKIGQPVVVGEMIAGVLLGPSLLGALAPSVSEFLFPKEILSIIGVVSQLGLVLFMFTVGLEFPTGQLRNAAGVGLTVSAMGILVPMALGAAFGYLAVDYLPMFGEGVPLYSGSLYLGLMLAITAFPMLARIISERGASGTRYGTLSLTAGSLDDAVAWVLLAFVLSVAGVGSSGGVWLAGLGFVALLAVLVVTRPLLVRLMTSRWAGGGDKMIAVAALLLLLASWFTDEIGIHAVFGAFALGVAFPRGHVSERLISVVRPLTVSLFLPLFFTYSGLNTDLRLLSSPAVLIGGLILVVVAFAGKLGSCGLAAKTMGESWGDSMRIGVLMNARGLMQLIALNIGMEAGIITPTLFALIVIVAIVTTLFTAPGLSLINRWQVRNDTSTDRDEQRHEEEEVPHGT